MSNVKKMYSRSTINPPSMTKPVVGGSVDIWGDILNNNIDNLSQFTENVVTILKAQQEEISSLESSKIGKEDLETEVKPIVQNIAETVGKETVDAYIQSQGYLDIDEYVRSKQAELKKYTDEVLKLSLDTYEKTKEEELNVFANTTIKLKIQEDASTYYSTTLVPQLNTATEEKIEEIKKEGQKQVDMITSVAEGLPERVQQLEDTRLLKGDYDGTASDLKKLIDEKQVSIDKPNSQDILSILTNVKNITAITTVRVESQSSPTLELRESYVVPIALA